MLHMETAIRVPGFPVLIHVVMAGCVYSVLVFGPCVEAP